MRSLIAALLLALPANAAYPPYPCEPDDATFHLLSQWRLTWNDARVSFPDRLAPLWDAIRKQPGNVFLHHAYQAIFLNAIESVRLPPVIAAYEKLASEHPTDLALKYAYARVLSGTRTADANQMLQELIAADPRFPWPHLELGRLSQNAEETSVFAKLCPATLAPEAYRTYRSLSPSFREAAARALRARLQTLSSPREAAVLPALWELEFQTTADRAAVRARISRDLENIRKLAEGNLTLLEAVQQGSNLVEDRESSRNARERIATLAPHSFATCRILIERWLSDRTRPSLEDSRTRVLGYYSELLDATAHWVEVCPLDETPWSLRFRAVQELSNVPPDQVLRAGEGLLRASAGDSSNSSIAPSIAVAEFFAERNIGFDRIPDLLDRNQRDSAARLAADRSVDWLPPSWKQSDEEQVAESRIKGQMLVLRKHLHDGHRELAAAQLAEMESGANSALRFAPILISAYLTMGETQKAAAALGVLKQQLESQEPGDAAGRSERLMQRDRWSKYWELAGALAEAEQRTGDALAAYRNVLQFCWNWDTLAARFATIDRAEALSKLSGEPPAVWEKWLAETTATLAAPAQNWDSVTRSFPPFSLVDLSGRQWTQADLRGKVTVINLWATWCTPCVTELPYVQKIHDAFRQRPDVQVITLNVDANPGAIEPFLKQRGITSLPVIPARDFVLHVLNMNGFPRTWIVDRDGIARREQAGFTAEPAKWVEKVLESLK